MIIKTKIESLNIYTCNMCKMLLVGWQEGHLACKKLSGGGWCGYLSGVRCRFAYGPADATATHCLCFSKFQIGFTFLIPAHPVNPGKSPEGCKTGVCVCACVCVAVFLFLW